MNSQLIARSLNPHYLRLPGLSRSLVGVPYVPSVYRLCRVLLEFRRFVVRQRHVCDDLRRGEHCEQREG